VSPKRWTFIIAAALGVLGGALAFFPVTAAVGPVISAGGKVLEHVSDGMLDDCPRSVCACDARGECGVHGAVGFPDGGASCRCP